MSIEYWPDYFSDPICPCKRFQTFFSIVLVTSQHVDIVARRFSFLYHKATIKKETNIRKIQNRSNQINSVMLIWINIAAYMPHWIYYRLHVLDPVQVFLIKCDGMHMDCGLKTPHTLFDATKALLLPTYNDHVYFFVTAHWSLCRLVSSNRRYPCWL